MSSSADSSAGAKTTTGQSGPNGNGLEELLEELRRRNWVLHLFGGREAPEIYAAVFRWPTCADVIILRDGHVAPVEDAPAQQVATAPL